MENTKQYKIKILTSRGPVTIFYNDTEPMEQFEQRIIKQYGKFVQVSAIPVNN